MLWEPVAPSLRRILESDSARLTADMVRDLLQVAQEWKPAGYDAEMERRRLAYLGLDTPALERALARRYETTWQDMGRMNLNLVRLIAEVDASVYDFDAIRDLVDETGSKIDETDDHYRPFERLKEDAGLDVSLMEAERRLMVVDTLPVRCWWEPLRGRFEAAPWWPSKVHVVPHPRRPADPAYFLALLAETPGPKGLSRQSTSDRHRAAPKWYEVWWRSCSGDDPATGAPIFGPWHRTIASDDGDSYEPFGGAGGTWADSSGKPLPLPWVLMRNGIPEGCPWVWANHDVIETVHDVNVTWCNIFFVLDMQAHNELVLESDSVKAETIKGGPNRVQQIRRGDRLYAIQQTPQIGAMVDTIKDYMRALAITRRQSEDAYSWERGDPMTGVSRRIKNEPQEKARREHAKQRKREEEEQLGPLLLAMADAFGGSDYLDAGLRMRMTPREPPSYEEPMQAQQRASDAQKAGWVSEARAAVEAGWYPDVETAVVQGLSDDLEAAPAPPPAPFGAPPMGDSAEDDDGQQEAAGDGVGTETDEEPQG